MRRADLLDACHSSLPAICEQLKSKQDVEELAPLSGSCSLAIADLLLLHDAVAEAGQSDDTQLEKLVRIVKQVRKEHPPPSISASRSLF